MFEWYIPPFSIDVKAVALVYNIDKYIWKSLVKNKNQRSYPINGFDSPNQNL